MDRISDRILDYKRLCGRGAPVFTVAAARVGGTHNEGGPDLRDPERTAGLVEAPMHLRTHDLHWHARAALDIDVGKHILPPVTPEDRMDSETVKAALVEVLKLVQSISKEACPAIDDGTRPAEDLPQFTSKVWPVAAGMLGAALGKSIPCESNIFVDEQTKKPLAIGETVALVMKIIAEQETEEVPAQ